MLSRLRWTMVSPWWCPWVLPVFLVGSVMLVARPALLPGWLALCVLLGRVINAGIARVEAWLLVSDSGLLLRHPE